MKSKDITINGTVVKFNYQGCEYRLPYYLYEIISDENNCINVNITAKKNLPIGENVPFPFGNFSDGDYVNMSKRIKKLKKVNLAQIYDIEQIIL